MTGTYCTGNYEKMVRAQSEELSSHLLVGQIISQKPQPRYQFLVKILNSEPIKYKAILVFTYL